MNVFFTSLFILAVGLAQLFANDPYQIESLCNNSEKEAEPCTIVIFGATGDLTGRKLLPALYNLAQEGCLSKHTAVIGFARGAHTDNTFRKQMGEAIDQFGKKHSMDKGFWDEFKNKVFYHRADFEHPQGFENLQKLLLEIDRECGTKGNRLYYLATHPTQFSPIVKKLYEHQLIYAPPNCCSPNEKWSRIIIEKPFGYDLESAIRLQNDISRCADGSQIYRMDHYLGKEGVQNLLALRFECGLFEPLWNNEFIESVQITLSEDMGIGTRARFWEETGLLRDVFQNHMMQLLAIVAMEPPSGLDASYGPLEKIKVLNAIRPFPLDEMDQYVIRGQYGKGEIQGMSVPGYKQEEGVKESSSSETFIAAKIFIDTPRWSGVPFYVRCGKRLPKQLAEIAIVFKPPPTRTQKEVSNVLFIRIQPNAGVFLKTLSKVPMLEKIMQSVVFGYSPDSYFKKSSPEAYEKLLYDCMRGDNRLYVQGEEQLAAWRLLAPVLDYWKSQEHALGSIKIYDAGTWGPSDAEKLLNDRGHQWQSLEN